MTKMFTELHFFYFVFSAYVTMKYEYLFSALYSPVVKRENITLVANFCIYQLIERINFNFVTNFRKFKAIFS